MAGVHQEELRRSKLSFVTTSEAKKVRNDWRKNPDCSCYSTIPALGQARCNGP